MLKFYVIKGMGDVWPAQIVDKKQAPMTGVFTGTESILTDLWAGDDEAVITTFPAIWQNGPAGTITIPVPAATSAALDVGLYQGLVRLADDSEALVRFSLDVRHAPGTILQTITPYAGYGDMQLLAPWVALVQGDDDLAGFLEQRIEARRWLDWVIINNYRGASVGLFETHSTMAFVFGGGVGWRRSIGPSPSLIDYLQKNDLIVRPQISRVCAMKAVSLVGLAQIGINNQYAAFGAYYRDMAERELVGLTAEVDLNGDGIGELFINLSSTNTLMT